jgi:isopentenyl diphosphate isomerase/L-lactate dehydrogenase-like FMN-dependent dehydrogenase
VLGGRVRATTSELFSLVSASVVWRDLERLAADSGPPVIVKGVLTAEDARLACASMGQQGSWSRTTAAANSTA